MWLVHFPSANKRILNFWFLHHSYIHYSLLDINIPWNISQENVQHYTDSWDWFLDFGEVNYYMSHQHHIYSLKDNIAKRMSTKKSNLKLNSWDM